MNACRSFAEQPGGFEEMFASSLQLPACVTPDQMMLVAADVDSGLDALRLPYVWMWMQDIGVGTIIGPWRCYMMLDEEYKRLQLSVPTDWQCADYECREQAWQELLHRSAPAQHDKLQPRRSNQQ